MIDLMYNSVLKDVIQSSLELMEFVNVENMKQKE